MQISDLVGQYSRNVANGTEELHGAQSVQKLVSTIGDLSAGSIFEGTINSVRGGKVTLAEMLENYIHHLEHHLVFVAKKRKQFAAQTA